MTEVNKSHYHRLVSDVALDATTTSSSTPIDVSTFNNGTYQVIWSGMTGTADYALQVSLDGTTYDTVQGSEATTSGASGSASESFTDVIPGGLIKFVVTTPAAAGTIDFYLLAKRG